MRPVSSESYQARHNYAQDYTGELTQIIADCYGLTPDDVRVYDDASDSEGIERDLAGIDAEVVFPSGQTKTVSYRTRLQREQYEVDLSLRCLSINGNPSEWYKWHGVWTGHKDAEVMPDVILFARTYKDGSIDDWHLIDTEAMLDIIIPDADQYPERVSNGGGDGTARYIPLADIESAVLRSSC